MRCVIWPIQRSILTYSFLGSLWERISIDSELVWLLTSSTVRLRGVDTHPPLSWCQYQTNHHKHHVELPQRTCADD